MDNRTQTLARLSGLSPAWGSLFNAEGIAIHQTDPNSNDRSTADTVALMSTHARNAASSNQIKQALIQAGVAGSGMSEDEIIKKVFSFIKSNVEFVEDEQQLAAIFNQPDGKELLITPPVLLGMNHPKGDCDDFSMLACAMLMAKGIKCDFITIAANRHKPREFSHVYCLVRTREGRVIPFDASHGKEAGWETERAWRKQVWPVFDWNFGRRDLGMTVVDNFGQLVGNGMGRVWAEQFREGLRTRAIGGLGDCSYDDEGNLISCDDTVTPAQATLMTGPNVTPAELSTMNTTGNVTPTSGSIATITNPSGGVNWNNLLPGLFQAVEKVAVQTTQPAGISTTTCNAAGVCSQSQTVLPPGATSIVADSLSSISSFLPLIFLGFAGVFLFDKLDKG